MVDSTSNVQNGVQIRWILENAAGKSATSHGNSDSVYFLQGGKTTRKVPEVFVSTDIVDSTGALTPDGIPDMFNYASHIHLETMPDRGIGN